MVASRTAVADPAEALSGRRAALWRRLRQPGGRIGWGLADQAVSSLTNAAMSIYVARELGAVAFGAFSLAYVTYAFALNASRGLATDPLTVRFSGAEIPVWRRAVASSSGTALIVGFIIGACALRPGPLPGTARFAFVALGVTLPGLLLQDSWRYAFFAIGRGRGAFLNDTIWARDDGARAGDPAENRSRERLHRCPGVGLGGERRRRYRAAADADCPRVFSGWPWVSRHRDLGPRYLVENTAFSGAAQLRVYGIGLMLGLAVVGHIAAAGTLMGPFQAVVMGISLVTVPEAARILRRSPRHLGLFCVLVGAILAVRRSPGEPR